jgi:hypothetical protein
VVVEYELCGQDGTRGRHRAALDRYVQAARVVRVTQHFQVLGFFKYLRNRFRWQLKNPKFLGYGKIFNCLATEKIISLATEKIISMATEKTISMATEKVTSFSNGKK